MDNRKSNEAASVPRPRESDCWKEIKDILEEEANQLALILDNGKTDARIKDAGFSHRVEIAIRREMNRLRSLAVFADSNNRITESGT